MEYKKGVALDRVLRAVGVHWRPLDNSTIRYAVCGSRSVPPNGVANRHVGPDFPSTSFFLSWTHLRSNPWSLNRVLARSRLKCIKIS